MYRNADGWIDVFNSYGSLWIYSRKPEEPHALLDSGKHTDVFFVGRFLIPHGNILQEACSDLLDIFSGSVKKGDLSKVRGIIGLQTGATNNLTEYLSRIIANLSNQGCFWASPAKNEENEIKSMVFTAGEKKLLVGQTVLLCKDVLTTGRTVALAEKAIKEQGGIVLPYILVLVNRSGLLEVAGKKIVALINLYASIWSPEECPLCQQGSEALPPRK